MATGITTQLMFQGAAEEAMTFYVSLFSASAIVEVERYGPDGPGREGSIRTARFTLSGQEFRCIDSPVEHDFSFTPAMSIFVDCESEAELNDAFARLSEDGLELMPLACYGFSSSFGWLVDRYGVSWQLNLP